ncbi:MAG TPA: methionine--tRNA ligase [Firmicutes bacterium]|nr:methionine--tRNA ligase [Bacillota bacterium]
MPRYLITSALPYINGIKHIGNLAGALLPADIYARFLRGEGEEVLFICATDDHGTPAEIGAKEEGLSTKDYCRLWHERQQEVYRRFGLSFDFFGETSAPQNHELTRHFYRKLAARGYIEEKVIEQVYSVEDGRFLPDRYIIGTCPQCGYEAALGDQCEKCTALLDPKDLIGPRSLLSGTADLEWRPTKHLFLKLDKLADEVRAWVDAHREEWPRLVSSIAYKWLAEGLKERCITRDLSWGVPVPLLEYEGKVFYVWFDAPIGYISATRQWSDLDPERRDWRRWWYAADDVRYVQFMAKDNVPFHTIFFPAMIIGTGEPWTKASYIKGFSWLTYYGGKFSTSRKRGIFLDQAISLFPADYWRYFLTAQAPEADDSDFTWELFASVVNRDLANNFGNYVQRTLKLTQKYFGLTVPGGGELGPAEQRLENDCRELCTEYRTHLRQLEYRKAAYALQRLWSRGNLYLEERAPWSLVKSDREAAASVLRTAINLIRLFAAAAAPIIPFTAETVFRHLHLSAEERTAIDATRINLNYLKPGHGFEIPPPLFRRIEAEEVERLTAAYAGDR